MKFISFYKIVLDVRYCLFILVAYLTFFFLNKGGFFFFFFFFMLCNKVPNFFLCDIHSLSPRKEDICWVGLIFYVEVL